MVPPACCYIVKNPTDVQGGRYSLQKVYRLHSRCDLRCICLIREFGRTSSGRSHISLYTRTYALCFVAASRAELARASMQRIEASFFDPMNRCGSRSVHHVIDLVFCRKVLDI